MGREFLLPFSIDMKPVNNPKNKNVQRRCSDGTLNQLWRYGGEAQSPGDSELEDKLEKILAWVAKEINQ